MLFSCEKCGNDMVARAKGASDQVYCPACQRIDSSQYFCQECWQTAGVRYYSEIMEDSRLRCNRCGRISKNPDLPQKNLRKAISFFQTSFIEISEFMKDLKFGLAIVRSLRR